MEEGGGGGGGDSPEKRGSLPFLELELNRSPKTKSYRYPKSDSGFELFMQEYQTILDKEIRQIC